MTEFYNQNFETLSTGSLAGQDSFTNYGGAVAEVVTNRSVGKKSVLLNGFGGGKRSVSTTGNLVTLRWAHFIEADTGPVSDYQTFCLLRLFDGERFTECRIGADYLKAGTARAIATPSFMVGKWLDCRWMVDLARERSWLWIDNIPLFSDEPLSPPFGATAVDNIAFFNSEGLIYDSNGFEGFNTGDLSGQPGWQTYGSYGSGQVVDSSVYAGNRALSFSAFTANIFDLYPPNLECAFEVECAFRVNFTDGYTSMTLYNPYGYAFNSVYFWPSEMHWQLGYNTTITPGIWHKLKVVLHTEQNSCDYYLDDVLKYEGLYLVGIGMGRIKFAGASALDYGETFEIDDLTIRERLA
jgi:hypothetical protein